MSDFEVIQIYELSGEDYYIEYSIQGVWPFMAIIEKKFYDGDMEISIRGFGNTSEEAKSDARKKLFIYDPIFKLIEKNYE
jgi:hypothetical protein